LEIRTGRKDASKESCYHGRNVLSRYETAAQGGRKPYSIKESAKLENHIGRNTGKPGRKREGGKGVSILTSDKEEGKMRLRGHFFLWGSISGRGKIIEGSSNKEEEVIGVLHLERRKKGRIRKKSLYGGKALMR